MKREFKLNEIDSIAKEVITEITNAKSNGAVVVALSGELGAGKTTLTQSIAHKLGVNENLISPTFVIMKKYQIGPQNLSKYGRRSGSNRPISKGSAAGRAQAALLLGGLSDSSVHTRELAGLTLVHIDAYRLDSEKELEILGWQELVNDPKNIILIEWPERVTKLIPKDAIRMNLEHIDEETRGVEVVV